MGYSFRTPDETLEAGLRRIATSQIESALGELDGETDSREEAVHQVRKRCKKLRALVRLVRGAFHRYREENQTFRDAARSVAGVRDATARIETFDALMQHFRRDLDVERFSSIRNELDRRRQSVADRRLDDRIPEMRRLFESSLERVQAWALDDDGFDALERGLRRTYVRAIDAMERAERKRTGEAFHEWRKRVKYHALHARLLRRTWPAGLEGHGEAASELASLLGDHHDLHEFEPLLADPEIGPDGAREALRGLLLVRRQHLEDAALALGGKLFAESPKTLAKRWRAYFEG